LTPRDQHRLRHYELLSTPFETLERNIRIQLAGMLSAGGFDPARDIEGITENRWAHELAEWERFYNCERPHGAHRGKTPYEALKEKLQ
jgi:hypothetical protein